MPFYVGDPSLPSTHALPSYIVNSGPGTTRLANCPPAPAGIKANFRFIRKAFERGWMGLSERISRRQQRGCWAHPACSTALSYRISLVTDDVGSGCLLEISCLADMSSCYRRVGCPMVRREFDGDDIPEGEKAGLLAR